MVKNAETRLDKVDDYIRDWPHAGAVERQTAAAWAQRQMVDIGRVGVARANFSARLSQRNDPAAGPKDARALRRACSYLASLLGLDEAAYAGMAAVPLQAALQGLIHTAHLVGDTSGTACLDVLMNGLGQGPANWLRQNKLFVGGSTQAGNQVFHFGYDVGQECWNIRPIIVAGGVCFQGHSVPARAWHTMVVGANDYSQIVAERLSNGADFMVTTQMSGCTLLFKEHAGNLYVAHAWPDGSADLQPDPALRKAGVRLLQELRGQHGATAANFANATPGTMRSYGPGGTGLDGYDVGAVKLYIIGVNSGGWELYAQHVPRLPGNALRVYRIWPHPVVQV